MQTRAADDFDYIRARMNELKGEKVNVVEAVEIPPGFTIRVTGTRDSCRCGEPGSASQGCFVEDRIKEGGRLAHLSGPCKRGHKS